MELSIKELKNLHQNEDIFVLGSAASMDFVGKDFLKDRISIGCNFLFKDFPVKYTVAKELHAQDVKNASLVSKVILSKHPCGNLSYEPDKIPKPTDVDYYTFEHRQNQCGIVDWSVLGTDEIIVSWSTITSAIHIAAYMGAKSIFLMGVDGGVLNGKVNYSTYFADESKVDWYKEWIPKILPTTLELRDRLYDVYKCRVMLVSPFLNFKLEGHRFE